MGDEHEQPEVMTLEEAAEYLRLRPRTLYGLAQKGIVPGKKISNRWRFSREVLRAWMSERDGSSGESQQPEG